MAQSSPWDHDDRLTGLGSCHLRQAKTCSGQPSASSLITAAGTMPVRLSRTLRLSGASVLPCCPLSDVAPSPGQQGEDLPAPRPQLGGRRGSGRKSRVLELGAPAQGLWALEHPTAGGGGGQPADLGGQEVGALGGQP